MPINSGDKKYLAPINVRVTTPNFKLRGKSHVAAFRREMREAHRQGLEEGKGILQDVLYTKEIFDTGDLIQSVASRLFVRTTDIFSGTVHFNNPGKEYAYFVEHGRGPGLPPPLSKMLEWGTRHGKTFSDVVRISKHIGKKGTKPKRFMKQAEERIQRNYNQIVNRAVERFRTRNM